MRALPSIVQHVLTACLPENNFALCREVECGVSRVKEKDVLHRLHNKILTKVLLCQNVQNPMHCMIAPSAAQMQK